MTNKWRLGVAKGDMTTHGANKFSCVHTILYWPRQLQAIHYKLSKLNNIKK